MLLAMYDVMGRSIRKHAEAGKRLKVEENGRPEEEKNPQIIDKLQ